MAVDNKPCCCSAFCEATVFAIGVVATKVESSSFSTFPVIFIIESSFMVGAKFFLTAKAFDTDNEAIDAISCND